MTTDFFAEKDFNRIDSTALADASQFAFTVDVEEWFHVGAFENTLSRADWPQLESRVELQTHAVLSLLDDIGVKGTFFTLGWVAERCPALVKDIVEAGHELGCHGMDHQRLFNLSREELADDIKRSKALLEDASGTTVTGYRAPSFSLTPDVWWAYEILEDAGFQYSSSLYPVATDHYGAAAAPRVPFYPTNTGRLVEIPMTVCDLPFRRLPASGGGYFRLLPFALSRFLFEKALSQTKTPSLYYMHPWEMDEGQPFVKEAPWLSRFRHYTGQGKLPNKIRKLANKFSWGRMKDIYAPILSEHKSGG